MSLGLLLCVAMILALMGVIAVQGLRTFWPLPIERVTTRDGETILGVVTDRETYSATPSVRRELDRLSAAGLLPAGAVDGAGDPVRRLYRVGNRDIGQDPFRWVSVHSIASVDRPEEALFVEREAWGVWLGSMRAVVLVTELDPGAPADLAGRVQTPIGPGSMRRERGRDARGAEVTIERVRIPLEDLATPFEELHREARDRRERIEGIAEEELGAINAEIERLRLELREAELDAQGEVGRATPIAVWLAALAVCLGLAIGGAVMQRAGRGREANPWGRPRLGACMWIAAIPVGLFCALEHPWAGRAISPERLLEVRRDNTSRQAALLARYSEADARRMELEREDSRWRVEVVEPRTGRFAPRSLSEPGEAMQISSIVRAVPANSISGFGKLGVYLSRWHEFLTADPRSENTEGGVYPVIFGTVLLTLLLTVVVVPLGVVAAIYIREYARQGLLISIIRVAINNLAGVPSIVYGVFGLGFFCYTLGRYIDVGPNQPLAASGGLLSWWPLVVIATVVAIAGASLGLLWPTRQGATRRSRLGSTASAAIWIACASLAIVLIARSPYFGGFFASKAPSPTFGTRGILWGALTLALLTLPVVIVSTEEAIAAVPRSMREGSHGCGATTWQTIRRIVLPGAMPGILTGAILAMARGAGEVAPLMLVGVAKSASALPLDGEFPFIHADRTFLHLGFHIYDLGLQSPDSQAARPLVWTTTLLLLVVVLAMNLAAIILRARLRKRSGISAA